MNPTINPYEQRIAVQSTILNFINTLITENDLSPSMVEDALNKVIIQLHPLIISEILEDGKRIENFEKARQEMNVELEKMNMDGGVVTVPVDQEEVTDE